MIRLTLALLAIALPLQMAHAETKAERQARCAAQAEIVALAVAERENGRRENGAIRRITRARADSETPYTEAISPLVGWVYSLNAAQLESDVAGEFRTACEGYKP